MKVLLVQASAPPVKAKPRAARPGSGESLEKPRQHRSDPARQCQEFFALGHGHQLQGCEKLGRCSDFAAFTASLGVPLPFGPGGVPVGSLADKKHRRARGAKELIGQLNLTERIGHLPSELSTGERQRVALGRAFLNRPKVILADEPTGNLDGKNGEIVLRALADFAGEGGAVLLVTHDPGAGKYAHRTAQLEKGTLNPEPDRGMTGN